MMCKAGFAGGTGLKNVKGYPIYRHKSSTGTILVK